MLEYTVLFPHITPPHDFRKLHHILTSFKKAMRGPANCSYIHENYHKIHNTNITTSKSTPPLTPQQALPLPQSPPPPYADPPSTCPPHATYPTS